MKLRRNLGGAVNKSAAFEGLAEELKRLLEDTDLTTMMLKGEWGVGKTSAMRSIIDDLSKKGPLSGRTVSFVSLAGLNEISDERALFILGLDDVPEWAGSIVEAVKGVAEKAGGLAGGVSKTVETLSLIGLTSKMKGALVVLDEIERKGANLRIEDVFGAIIRLVENRDCKVVVVMNEGQLDDKSREALARYREKVFDFEYEFRLTPNEAVSAVADGEFKDLFVRGFEAIGVANLRVISQTYRAVTRVSENLKTTTSEGRLRILENVCQIAALRLTTESRLQLKDLESGMGVQMRTTRGGRLTPVQKKLEELNFYPSEADEIILAYLETGWLDANALQAAAIKEDAYGRERKLANEQMSLSGKLMSGFSSFGPEEVEKGKHILDECFSDCREWAFVSAMISTLEVLGVEINRAEYERKWASVSPLPKGGWAGEHAVGFTDHEALAILEERFSRREPQLGFDQVLERIAYGTFEAHWFASEPWTNAEWLYSRLSEQNRASTIEALREIWQRCENPGLQPHLADFRLALGKALSRLASANPISAKRVEFIRTGRWRPPRDDRQTV